MAGRRCGGVKWVFEERESSCCVRGEMEKQRTEGRVVGADGGSEVDGEEV